MTCPSCKKEIVSFPCPVCSDEKKLEAITDLVTKALLANAFEDRWNYVELSKRIAVLISQEVDHNKLHQKIQEEMLPYWPKSLVQ